MQIGVDARRIEGQPTGVGRYLINLLREWRISESNERYHLFFSRHCTAYPFLAQDSFIQHVLDRKVISNIKTLWEQAYLPLHLARVPLDVFFSPHYFLPFWLSAPAVVTIHDISYTTLPQEYPLAGRLKYHFCSSWSARHCRTVITTSEFSKREIIKYYEIPESKIAVIPLAVETAFKPLVKSQSIEEIRTKYGLFGPFFFYIGTIFPRRNVPNLLKSFKQVIQKHRDCKLLLIGENHLIPKRNFTRLIVELGLSDHVIWHPYVPEQDLVPLYCAAQALVYPSSYEGFGLPVLEAMACGTPVITTRCASLPEVAGEAGLFVNPQDLNELGDAMIRLLEDKDLRIRLREKGIQQASTFSWSKTAQETLEVIRKVASS